MKLKKIILYQGGACCENRLLVHLRRMGKEIHELVCTCDNYELDATLAQKLLFLIQDKKADGIMSVDYYPIIAQVAHTVGIPYLSWMIDAPHYTLYSPTSFYDEVYLFHFDREEVQRLIQMGRRHIFHQPLASDPDYFAKVAGDAGIQKTVDISFLGNSYQNEHDYFAKIKGISKYDEGYFDALINAQLGVYGASLFEGTLSGRQTDQLLKICGVQCPDNYDLPVRLLAENILEKRVSVLERGEMIKRVAEKFGIVLYSGKDDFPIKGVDYRGYADYETKMPLVFAGSRINLNTTLRRIHSGIPLRALDIMACGGFLLTNYQPELLEYFTPGKSLEIYESMEDLLEKCSFYLNHEKEREKIAECGRKIVREKFAYEKALSEMFEKIE